VAIMYESMVSKVDAGDFLLGLGKAGLVKLMAMGAVEKEVSS
jgi:hypothetical protein